MEIVKTTNTYSLIKIDIQNNDLLDLYSEYANQLTELDLSKKFAQYNYKHTKSTNPQWLELKTTENKTLQQVEKLFGFKNINSVVSLSKLPKGYELNEHRDIGRRSVLLIPIKGVTDPIHIGNEVIHYKDTCLLMDATAIHRVPKTNEDRVTLQFAFKQQYVKLLERIKRIIIEKDKNK